MKENGKIVEIKQFTSFPMRIVFIERICIFLFSSKHHSMHSIDNGQMEQILFINTKTVPIFYSKSRKFNPKFRSVHSHNFKFLVVVFIVHSLFFFYFGIWNIFHVDFHCIFKFKLCMHYKRKWWEKWKNFSNGHYEHFDDDLVICFAFT